MRIARVVATSLLVAYATASSQIVLGDTQVLLLPGRAQPSSASHVRDQVHIKLSGDIRVQAVARLAALFPEAQRKAQVFSHSGEPVVRLLLDSQGGEILAAVHLGRIVRAQGVEVWVDAGAECSSACILVLAAGVSRHAVPGAKLGLHRPYFQPDEFAGLTYSQAQQRYALLSSGIRDYLADMGIAQSLYEAMLAVPSQKMRYISHGFAESTRLLGDDPAYEEWRRAKDRQALGGSRQGMLDRYIDCINAGTPDRECARHLSHWNKAK